MTLRTCTILSLAAFGLALPAAAAELRDGLQKGTPEIKSISALAFGPEGILFVGDPISAEVFAIDTGDRSPAGSEPVAVEDLGGKVAGMLGITPDNLRIADMKVNPASGNVYLAALRGAGPKAAPVILRVGRDGKIGEFGLTDVPFARVALSNPTEGSGRGGRAVAITGLAYADGRVLVSGLTSEEWSSVLRSIPFPFKAGETAAGIGIFHGSHGRFETASPIRTFTPFRINKEPHILAAYTCTPLVTIPMSELKPGAQVKGKTVAELGNRNTPLDMVVYKKDGKDYILMSNDRRGVMKITTDGIDSIEPITERVREQAGLKYETVADLKGVRQLDKLDEARAVVLIDAGGGKMNLQTVPLP